MALTKCEECYSTISTTAAACPNCGAVVKPHIIRRVISNQASAVAIFYLYISFAGLLHSWLLVREFGINLLRYAEASDFLLAGFSRILRLFQGLVGLALVILTSSGAYSIESSERS